MRLVFWRQRWAQNSQVALLRKLDCTTTDMKAFLLFIGLPAAAVLTFFSGSLPYTLIYEEADLMGLSYDAKEPVTAEVVKCETGDTAKLRVGDVLETTFRATLTNHTDRYVVISAIGEIYAPRGSGGMHSQLMVLNPNSEESTSFKSNIPYLSAGSYRCEMRYAIGRFDY